jgi:hypothetical protein
MFPNFAMFHDVVNMARSVNIGRQPSSSLERDLARVLRELLSVASWLRGWSVESVKGGDDGWDLKASGPTPASGNAVLCVECKNFTFQPSSFRTWLVDRAPWAAVPLSPGSSPCRE